MNDKTSNLTLQTLQWQFSLTWKLSEYHLSTLTDKMCLWNPTPKSWTVRKSKSGTWKGDFSEKEPNPAPTVTIGWLTWHIIWWWTGIIATITGETPAKNNEINWPGNAADAVERIKELCIEWTSLMSKINHADLENPVAYPWSEPRPLRIAIAWVNSELMKNIAEIGYIRNLYEANYSNKT